MVISQASNYRVTVDVLEAELEVVVLSSLQDPLSGPLPSEMAGAAVSWPYS